MTKKSAESFWGDYKHFKGGRYYAYAEAHDQHGSVYILYQQLYTPNYFWIRPKEMFTELVQSTEGTEMVPRFSRYGKNRITQEEGIKKILEMTESAPLIVRHSETEEYYSVVSASSDKSFLVVCPIFANRIGGYLTDQQLALRMGYHLSYFDGKYVIHELPKEFQVTESQKLKIEHENFNSISILAQIGAASVDLHIADKGFLKTKKAVVDLVDLTHITNAKSLWEKVKLRRKRGNEEPYFELKKGESIVTHTLERIRIPFDCAGKIEIRSTYARLSLSVTTGDYCNPGYYGYYPLVLRNDGRHSIRIHTQEPMLQLVLITLSGVVIKNYPTRASFVNKLGIDEGNPYDFYRADVVKRMRREKGYDEILAVYNATLKAINANNTTNPTQTKERFADAFLSYCSSHIQNRKYRNEEASSKDSRYDTYELWKGFTQKEKNLQSLFSVKTKLITGILPLASWAVPLLVQKGIKIMALLPLGVPVTVLYAIAIVLLFVFDPRVYCTCERIDYDKLKK